LPAVKIAGVVKIKETPVPNLPVQLGSRVVTTNESGEFSVFVPSADVADISSGLLAVGYEKIAGIETEILTGTGSEIAAIAQANGGWIVIEAIQRVKPEDLCYITDSKTGAGFIRFAFTNRFGSTLTVESDKLNLISSLADPSRGSDQEPYPLSDFESIEADKPDGYLGFEWPLRYFVWFDPVRNQEVVSAQWKLINEIRSLDQPLSEVPLCPAPALLDGCRQYTTELSNRLYAQMFSTVTRLSQLAEAAARKGKWKNRDGRFRNPFLDRAARSLRTTRRLLNEVDSPAYVCPAGAPERCTATQFPKEQILNQFDQILRVKLPKALQFLNKAIGPERVKFRKALREQPDEIVLCK
jgi:hypothetical protein